MLHPLNILILILIVFFSSLGIVHFVQENLCRKKDIEEESIVSKKAKSSKKPSLDKKL